MIARDNDRALAGKVYVLLGDVRYEGYDILGIFTHKLSAEDEMIKRQATESSYVAYDIAAWELNTQEPHAQPCRPTLPATTNLEPATTALLMAKEH